MSYIPPAIGTKEHIFGWFVVDIGDFPRAKICEHLFSRTNLPKEIMAFPDLPFPSHLPSFMHHTDVLQYLQDYTDMFDLRKYIQVRW